MSRSRSIRLALVASVVAVLAACGGSPAAPALTDPTEILTQSVASLKDVKTVEMTGSFTGTVPAQGLGDFDLSAISLTAAADLETSKVKLSLNAPTLLNTTVEMLVVDNAAYIKAGGLAAMAIPGVSGDKWLKSEIPDSDDRPATDPAEIEEQIEAIRSQLAKLPTAPTKEANERCGDADCYHVKLSMTEAQFAPLVPGAEAIGDGGFTLDLWSRTSDLRPAKLAITAESSQTGTVGLTFEFRYDVAVNVEAPPADQVITQ